MWNQTSRSDPDIRSWRPKEIHEIMHCRLSSGFWRSHVKKYAPFLRDDVIARLRVAMEGVPKGSSYLFTQICADVLYERSRTPTKETPSNPLVRHAMSLGALLLKPLETGYHSCLRESYIPNLPPWIKEAPWLQDYVL